MKGKRNYLIFGILIVSVVLLAGCTGGTPEGGQPSQNDSTTGLECSVGSDCGTNGYVGSYYCQEENVVRDYKTYSCVSEACQVTTSVNTLDTCDVDEICVEGQSICQTVEAPTQPLVSMGETAKTAELELTVNSIDYKDYIKYESWKPDAGNTYLVVDFTIKNVGTDDLYTSLSYFFIKDKDAYLYDYDSHTFSVEQGFESGDISSGSMRRGKIVFEIPEDAEGLIFMWKDTELVQLT